LSINVAVLQYDDSKPEGEITHTMSEHILIGVAWPYVNGSPHIGHIAGAYLPADIFARYHRLKGNHVLMVSGSDQHGTPVTISAEKEGVSPQEIATRYHNEYVSCWDKLGITFDIYTTTGTDNHREVTHDIFLTLLDKDLLYTKVTTQPYWPAGKRFLPDRYVEGTCPYCGNPSARGDQCDQCGKTLDPQELIDPRCRMDGTAPEFRDTEHFFIRLSAFQDQLYQWTENKSYWRPNVLNFTRRYLEDGLQDRPITRDIKWGVPVPVEGYEDKRIYVWFEAVIGYLSAAKEAAHRMGDPDVWKRYWQNSDSKVYNFIGKDNIPFHTLIWPAMLMGYGDHSLPYDVPANEFVTIEGRKLSTSHNWAVWVPDYLERYEPDPLRYYLSINMPETGDTDFSWSEFVRRNNDELVATYGNLIHRVLSFTHRSFNGHVPEPGGLDEADQHLLDQGKQLLGEVDESLSLCHFREGIRSCFSFAQQVNRYLDAKAPWKTIKVDRQQAATSLWVAMQGISCLKTVTAPFLPFTAGKLHSSLGLSGTVEDTGWNADIVQGGQPFPKPEPLFHKLDESVVEEETQRLRSDAGRE
jgi:methionyl-tRNA synthetase